MNQKGFVNIILVVVIVMLVGVAGYFAFVKKSPPIAQQTPTPTTPASQTPTPKDEIANWKTYRNELMGIEIKYPDKYFVEGNYNNSGSDIYTYITVLGKESDRETWSTQAGGSVINSSLSYIQIAYHVNRSNLSTENLAKNVNSVATTTSCKYITVAGENALRCSLNIENPDQSYSDRVFLKHSGAIYSFAATSPTSNDSVRSDLLEILSTLKFLQ